MAAAMTAPASYEATLAMFAQMELIDQLAAKTNATRAQIAQDQMASGIVMDEYLTMRLAEVATVGTPEASEADDAAPGVAAVPTGNSLGSGSEIPAPASPPPDASMLMMQQMMQMFREVLDMRSAAPAAPNGSAHGHLANAKLDER